MFGIADYGAFVAALIVFLLIPGPGHLALLSSTGKGGIKAGVASVTALLAAKPGAGPILNIRPQHYLKQAFVHHLLNPKALVFYMAFFPLFVDPTQHLGLPTFVAMAATIAALTLAYGLIVTLLTHPLAAHIKQNPGISRVIEKVAGVVLIGFGLKLVLSR